MSVGTALHSCWPENHGPDVSVFDGLERMAYRHRGSPRQDNAQHHVDAHGMEYSGG